MSTFGVATKGIVKNQEGKYLILIKSSLEEINPNTYDLPGGRMSFGEKPEEAIVREVSEETGLKVEPIKVFEVWTFTKEDFQLVGINFLCNLISGELKLSEEHDKSEWLSYEEINKNKEIPEWLLNTIKKAQELNE